VSSGLFPGSEGYVRGTKTIVTYDLDLKSGSAALDAQHRSFSTHQSWTERFWEFFRLGAEHLLTGLDHILFLLALIAGSRRLREIVLAATTFTLAHSVTFVLAALGLVRVSASFVEPVIALSIAVVAGWHLWRIWRRRSHATDLETAGHGHLSLDSAGWTRLGVVFCFGLVHGLGFASALGIDQAWSWTLLWSLLVFNVGIETVQLAIIMAVFPLLALLRHRRPAAGLWTTGTLAAGVTVMGLVWFVQRVL
jgi:hydrogenase/urease accessory protein HupE